MENSPIIALEDVKIKQGNATILEKTNLHIKKGELLYLIGKTGSGKSSLMQAIYGEIPIVEGKGTVAGFDLNKLKSRKIPYLRRKLGIVFQDFQLLTDRTVKDNLLFVMKATGWKSKKEMLERANKVLEMVHLSECLNKMPHQLSGGQQQRVAIARALVNKPEIILADEPTGNLDPETSNEIMKILFEIANEGTAVIIATHNYELIQAFPARTIRCESQTILEGEASKLTASVNG